MELKSFKKKFEIIKEYENEMPGIAIGLDVLRQINFSKPSFSKDSKLNVFYYDFVDYEIYNYSLRNLNISIRQIYNQSILYEKIILYNKLYWIFCDSYNKLYQNHYYAYNNNNYNMYDIINKFFHGLRLKNTSNPLKFFVHEVMTIYTTRYFDEKVSYEEFYMFMCDLILDLWEKDVLVYNHLENSIIFNSHYYNDLSEDDIATKLDKIHNNYKTSNKENKKNIDDLLTSLVISSSVETISAELNINNIFIETIIYGLANSIK